MDLFLSLLKQRLQSEAINTPHVEVKAVDDRFIVAYGSLLSLRNSTYYVVRSIEALGQIHAMADKPCERDRIRGWFNVEPTVEVLTFPPPCEVTGPSVEGHTIHVINL